MGNPLFPAVDSDSLLFPPAVRKANQPVANVKDFGAKGTGVDDTAAIQSAVDAMSARGGGVVYFPNGTYGIDGYKGDQATYSNALRGGIRLAAGVILRGESRYGVTLKNIANAWTSIINIRGGAGIEIHDLVIDGDWPNRPSAALSDSSTRGEAIIYWNGSSEATDHVIKNVTVKNTGHYGIGVQNVAVNRMRIDGCIGLNLGGDFIDIKEFTADSSTSTPAYPKAGIIVTNCWVDTFGLNATVAQQEADAAGFDLRGEVLASNIHVYNLNSYNEPDTGNAMIGANGIRINGDLASNYRLGGRKVRVIGGSVTSNKGNGEGSETAKRIIGVRIGSSNASVVGVATENCYIGFRVILTGDSTPVGTEIIGCHAINNRGAAADGKGLSIEGASQPLLVSVDMTVINSDIGVACLGAGVAGRVQLSGNTVDHRITETNLAANDLQFDTVAAPNTTGGIARATRNNLRDLTVWNTTQPKLTLRSTFDGTWTSPYDDGVVSFESADTSGAGAGVRAEIRARMTGSTGGGTGLILRANAGSGLVDAVTVNGDRVYINPALLPNAASDSAAATAGVAVNGLYRNGSVLMIRMAEQEPPRLLREARGFSSFAVL